MFIVDICLVFHKLVFITNIAMQSLLSLMCGKLASVFLLYFIIAYTNEPCFHLQEVIRSFCSWFYGAVTPWELGGVSHESGPHQNNMLQSNYRNKWLLNPALCLASLLFSWKHLRAHLGFAWVLSVISQREAYLAERKRKSFGESGRKEQCVKRRNPFIFSWKKGHCTSSFALPSVLYLHYALTETSKLLMLLMFVF